MAVYFLTKGEVAFVVPECEDMAFLVIEEGDVFGVIDLVPESGQSVIDKEVTRTFSAMALDQSEVLSLQIDVSELD